MTWCWEPNTIGVVEAMMPMRGLTQVLEDSVTKPL